MIRVAEKPEPDVFEERVRTPGKAYLKNTPNPTSKEFSSHAYWTRVLDELRSAYGKVCAYSCFWIPAATGVDTVEHYLPKVQHPIDAYEWKNYRYVSHKLNQRKGTKEDVVDPFQIENGWFIIEFPSLMVVPNGALDAATSKLVQDSIDRVGLNDPGGCLDQRAQYVEDYCRGLVIFDFLQRDAPFLAAEIERQGIRETLKDLMKFAPESVDDRS